MRRRWHIGSPLQDLELIDSLQASDEERRLAMPAKGAVRAMEGALRSSSWEVRDLLADLRGGALDRHAPRAHARDQVVPTLLHSIQERRLLLVAKAKQPTRGKTADVVVVTSDGGDELEHTKIVAKALHGRGAEIHVVGTPEKLIDYVKQFDSIRRVVFMFHGQSGAIEVGAFVKSLSWFAHEFQRADRIPRCGELVFEGCHVGSGGAEIASLMEVLQTKSATGYAAFHAWDISSVRTYRGQTIEQLDGDRNFRRVKRFIIAGQPPAAEMVRRPGDYAVAYEYFSSSWPDKNIFSSGMSGQLDRLYDRSKLGRQTFSMKNADQTTQFDTVIGSMTIVTITR
jgi:hypothetical protein